MMISEEALYAAAPEAAEKFLSALPDREDCVHDLSLIHISEPTRP